MLAGLGFGLKMESVDEYFGLGRDCESVLIGEVQVLLFSSAPSQTCDGGPLPKRSEISHLNLEPRW